MSSEAQGADSLSALNQHRNIDEGPETAPGSTLLDCVYIDIGGLILEKRHMMSVDQRVTKWTRHLSAPTTAGMTDPRHDTPYGLLTYE